MAQKNPTLETIFTRRSVRRYTGEKICREDLELLVRAGMAAPTSKDTRHFFFIVIDDDKAIEKMTEGLPYAKMLITAKHAIVVCSDLSIAYGGAEIGYWIQDSAAAAENVLVAAHAMGLGACWTGVHPRPERVEFLRKEFSIPENVMPLCVIALGRPAGEDKPRDKFDPSHLFWNGWGKII
ncbi:MAG: nitroreductase family protein [Candidatus Omnitrophica bacterium]|nr:nitroreductase family protein [Candidatus Omnitrophota bacterium]